MGPMAHATCLALPPEQAHAELWLVWAASRAAIYPAQRGCSALRLALAADYADLCGASPCRSARSLEDMSPGTLALLQAAGTSQPTPTSLGSRVASAPSAGDSMLQPANQESRGAHPYLTRAGSSSADMESPRQSSAAIRQGFSDLVRQRAVAGDMPQGMGFSGGAHGFPQADANVQGQAGALCSVCGRCRCRLCLRGRTSS